MGIFLDVVLILIFAISVFLGYRKGLIKVVFSLCAFVLSIIITFLIYTPVTNWVINNTEFDENIKEIIIEKGLGSSKEENTDNSYTEQYLNKYLEETKDNVVDEAAILISQKVIAIVVAIVLFVAIRIILILLRFVIDGIASLPIIKQFNSLGGILYGVLRGGVLVYAILAVMFFVISINGTGLIADAINTSIISKIIYSNNILLNIIFK